MKAGLIIMACCVGVALLILLGGYITQKHPKKSAEVLDGLEKGAKKAKDKAVAEYQEHIKS